MIHGDAPSPLPTAATVLVTRVETVVDIIARALSDLNEGRPVTLADLDQPLRGLCAALSTLSPEDARPYLPVMEGLLASYEVLEQALRRQAEALGLETAPAAEPRLASRAYTRLDGGTNGGPPKTSS